MTAPAFDPLALASLLARHGHNRRLGLTYVAHGPDWAALSLPYDPALASDETGGVLASGPIVGLMDMASGMSIWVRRGRFEPQVTLDLRLDYLRPAIPGRAIVGRGECYRLTRSVAFVRGQAHDGDPADPIAHVAGTFMRLDAP